MTDYLNIAWQGSPIPVPPSDRLNLPGHWADVRFDQDIADAAGHHAAGSHLFGKGPRFINGKLLLRLEGFTPGVEIQVRTYEVRADGSRVEGHEPDEFYTSPIPPDSDEAGNYLYPARTHKHLHIWSYINTGHRLGVELSQWPHGPASAPTGVIAFAQFVGTLEAP
ncbi:hypothetical protein GCM10010182_67730 [Actinomadura cremea]|nr:hypothetical protein GCM10010182_67730 [Actinomadura cremea]